MKRCTFIKKFVTLLFVVTLLLPTFAVGQETNLSQRRKELKERKENLRSETCNPKMMQTRETLNTLQSIPSATKFTKTSVGKDTYRRPLAVTESGANLYGNLIYNALWEDLSSVGFYTIDPNTAEYTPVGTSEYLAGAGTVVNGIAYVSYAVTFWGLVEELYTIVYDVENSTIINVIELNPEDATQYAINMAYDYSNDVIYAMTYSEDYSGYLLCKFDRNTGTYTKLTTVYVSQEIFAMTFDDKGSLYAMCDDGIIRELSIVNGTTIREVCNTGFQPYYMQSACWSPKDGKILWAASNDSESHIIAVDITSGTSEILCSFNLAEEWTCLYTTDPIVSEDAATAPVITYTENAPGSLYGSITVKTPTQTIGGEDISAEYTLVIELNGTEIYNNTVTPGNDVTINDVTLIEGFNTIRSYAISEAGKGDFASLKIYAGNDRPSPVTNLEVSINDNGEATLNWTAPTTGENGGYVDLSALTYTIERSGETVATGVTNNYYVDQLPNQLASHQWTVYAVSNDKVSKPTSTGKILFGDALSLPYEQTFNNEECLELYTIVDVNNDNCSWKYDATKEALTYTYNSINDADDYAFTPALQLSNEKMLRVEVNTCAYSVNYPEKIEITFGPTSNPEEQTVIIPETTLTSNVPQTLSTYFHVEESGEYYIGIHAVSDADNYYLLVKDIVVKEGPSYDVPAAVSDVVATPDDKGALTATLSFKAPTQSLVGNTLTEDVTITAYRNDEVIGTVTLAPGATGSITDNNASEGINNYVLVTSNSIGEGDTYEISCFCGLDIPNYVSNFKFTTTEDNLTSVMSWEAPANGKNGGYINPEELVYTVYTLTEDGNFVEPVTETSNLSYEIKVDNKDLIAYSYYVSAKNTAGEGNLFGGSVVLGSPYTLPFIENIEGTALANSPWQVDKEDPNSYATWGLGGIMQDYNLPETVIAPDGGMAVCYDFYEVSGGVCSMTSPKISLVGANSPALYFSMYHYNTADDINKLSVLITTNDATYDEVFTKKVNETEGYGWAEYRVNLDEYKDAPWIGIMFKAQISSNGFIFLDNIIVENVADNDVLVESFTSPTKVTVGEEIDITTKVFNKGNNAASYDVSFYVGDEKIAIIAETELASNELKEYTAKFTPKAENIGKNTAKVVITMNGATDEIIDNNEATIEITVLQPHLRVVTDLKAVEEDGKAKLTWSAPTLAPLPTIDDIENYESFIISNIGEYTIVDADNVETYGIEGYNVPLPNGPKAWQVWSASEIGIEEETWQAHEGNKCLVAFSTISGAANDWLISPEVIGGTEISFWAAMPTTVYGNEQFEVLYSTTDTNIGSFELISKESKSSTDWEQFTYILPDDAKYFAIRYTSVDIFALLIDDISYTKQSSDIDLNLIGYNVYCNGKKINNEDVTETVYSYDLERNDDYSFNVTVIYDQGESLLSNTAILGEVSIDENIASFNIYPNPVNDRLYIETEVDIKEVAIYTLTGVMVGQQTTDNRQQTLSIDVTNLNSGVYFVKVVTDNGEVVKRFVKK